MGKYLSDTQNDIDVADYRTELFILFGFLWFRAGNAIRYCSSTS